MSEVDLPTGPFDDATTAPAVHVGPGRRADVGALLAETGCERGLVICGGSVGANDALMDPLREGLGESLAGVFDGTTADKRASTAVDALERYREADADALVAVGGGSSLDVATVTRALAGTDSEADALRAEIREGLAIPTGDGPLAPLYVVPTTLAGADRSPVAGITIETDDGPVSSGVSDPRLAPTAGVYDPEALATTPPVVLAGSAMNGFDKGIEVLTSRHATPITDATAIRGLRYLAAGLPDLRGGGDDALSRALIGTVLVQQGATVPGATKLSLTHAFGHGLRDVAAVQQGVAHAVVAPHALEYVFAAVDGRRATLARALGVGDADEPAAAVIERVTAIRDALEVPTRLRDLEGLGRSALDAVAERTARDAFLGNGPAGLEPETADLRAVLEAAW